MTTATPLGDTTFFSLNMTTRRKTFGIRVRKMRTRRELEPKGPKPAAPAALGPNGNSSQQPATVTFGPVDVHEETR
uniref:Uncharacterized protein n=1 Tax=Microcebus murinus TaxID=30608 RepID=A0A8C5UZ75_MICMU